MSTYEKYHKQYYQENKEKILKYQKERQKTNPVDKEYHKKYYEKYYKENKEKNKYKRYGLTLEEYNEISKTQNDCCAICGKHKSKLKKELVVDHCHSTGKVRGLLCYGCNTSLGVFNDDIRILQKAINYLKNYKKL